MQDNPKLFAAAGLLYAALIAAGLTAEFAIRQALFDPASASQTLQNITAAEGLFQTGFALDTGMVVADIALALVLFALFRGLHPTLALTAMVFRLVQASVLATGLVVSQAVLSLAQTDAALAHGLMSLHAQIYDIGLIFFGINSLAMAALLWLSRVRVLALLIAGAGLVYLTGSFVRFLAPDWLAAVQPAYALPILAETSFALWLFWQGLRAYVPVRKAAIKPAIS